MERIDGTIAEAEMLSESVTKRTPEIGEHEGKMIENGDLEMIEDEAIEVVTPEVVGGAGSTELRETSGMCRCSKSDIGKADIACRGIPAVKASAPKAKDDGGRDDAIAKAKAAVEAENKKEREEKETTDKVESKEQDGAVEPSTKTVAENAQGDADAAAGKKRAREEDDGDLEAQRASKKVNVKEAHPVDVAS